MIVIPAIDLRDGACVQLVGGDYARERVRVDALDALDRWIDAGFRRLHVVDLDAATLVGSNTALIRTLLARARQAEVVVQVGGGLRDDAAVDAVMAAGADFSVIGTRAVDDPAWLATLTARHPGRVIVAADVRHERVLTRGWSLDSTREVEAVVDHCNTLSVAGVLVTAVHREGQLAGPDLDLMARIRGRAALPVIASGGIASVADLRALHDLGVAAAVVGMALYRGALQPTATAQEFAG